MAEEDERTPADDTGEAGPAVLSTRDPFGRFTAGRSGNPGGRPTGERELLARMYGEDGRKVFKWLEQLRRDPETPRRLKAQIDFFLIERQFGRAPQLFGLEGGPSLLSLLAEMAARSAPAVDR